MKNHFSSLRASLIRAAGLGLLALVLATAAHAQTAAITTTTANYSASGGSATFTVNLGYTGTPSSLSVEVNIPTGWSYASAAGSNVPNLTPSSGATGEMDFAWFVVPANGATFTFTANYNAGLTGAQAITPNYVYVGDSSGNITTITVAAIDIVPPKSNQTITFNSLGGQTYGNSAFSVSATASSGLTVSFYIVSGPATISNSTITLTGAGTVVVGATQPGNGTTNAASEVDQSFAVAKASGSVTVGSASLAYNGSPQGVTSTTTPVSLGVTYSYTGTGSTTYGPSSTAPTNAGTYSVAAAINDTNYQGTGSGSLTLTPAGQTITFGALSSQSYSASFGLTAAASSGLGITYTIASGPATVLGSTVTVTGVGAVTVQASQAGNGNYNAATSVQQSFTAVQSSQTIAFANPGTQTFGVAPFALGASASSGLTVGFSIVSGPATLAGSTITLTGAGSVTVAASQAGGTDYTGATTVDQTFAVSKAVATVSLGNLSQAYTNAAKAASATTTPSGLTVNLTYNGSGTAPSAVGSYAVVGTISDANYQGSANGILAIGQGAGSVTLSGLSATYDGTAKSATATTTPLGISVAFTYGGSSTAPTAPGNYAVVATISDSSYPAATASGVLTIAQAAATVTLGSLSQTYSGSPESATASTTPGSLAVSFTYNGSTTAPTAPGSYAVIGTVNDPLYQGSASGTLAIAKAAATVTLGGLSQTYSGVPEMATATTNPASLATVLTYEGSATVPTNAGSYAVIATINDPDYQGATVGTMTIAKAALTVTAGSASQQQGQANGSLSVSYSGFVNGESASVLTTAPTAASAAGTSSSAGTYASVASGGAAANYTLGYDTGTVTVTSPPASATFAVGGTGAAATGYNPGGTTIITNTITYAGAISGYSWTAVLPAASWTYAGVGLTNAPDSEDTSTPGIIVFSWATPPASPFTFTYVVNVPTAATGLQQIQSIYAGTSSGNTFQGVALSLPSAMASVPQFHSADFARAGAISLLDLTRVIALYNYSSGTARTGQYHVDDTTIDGFAPGPSSP